MRLRRTQGALPRGGFRWAHVGDDVLVLLRETRDERVLVQVARAPHRPVELPVGALGTAAAPVTLLGAAARVRDDVIEVPGDGPSAGVWLLPTG